MLVAGASAVVVYYSLDQALMEVTQRTRWNLLHVEEARRILKWPFLWSLSLNLLGAGILSLFWFHRMAGPLDGIRRALRRIADGDFSQELRLRDTDEFKDLGWEINCLQSQIREKTAAHQIQMLQIREKLDSIMEQAKQKKDIQHWLPVLEEIRSQLQA